MATVVSVSRARKEPTTGFRRLPKLTAPVLRLNGLAPYYTMFPITFPFTALANAEQGDWVLDPFCGRGTTILAARLRGLASVGIDSNPVAGAIASSKLAQIRPREVIRLAKEILDDPKPGPVRDLPHGDFWDLCYAPRTLRDVCRIRNYLIENCSTRIEIALRGVMLGILHGPQNAKTPTYLSNQMPRTYSTKPVSAVRYWRKNKLKPPEIGVLDAISRRAKFSFQEVPDSTPGKVVLGDSRTFNFAQLGAKFSWVITSPPYYGMRTYFPDHWLRNWFVGGPSDVEYRTADQLSHHGEDQFITDLATVWKQSAGVCFSGARLVCRFGALGSCEKNPRDMVRRSLTEAGCGWKIKTIRDAGTSKQGHRQCEQFGTSKNVPLDEIDVYAVLEL